ncbi:hypothetical protein HPB52_003843 [Rhipicephalus sanguineus]|uniref:DNA repair protein REV1 n=1 Tax=Rhipicephalus sanguineus TaxID=34632 RepID=A0A9D4PU55_RHISA|nr:hypothetical protein HPB52_003843 [Rhipicephalus sanguineus]
MGKRSRRKRFGPTGFEEFGGYMNAKIQKLENQFLNSAQNEIDSSQEDQSSTIFKGISVFVNGYTNPTAEEIRRIMMLHGGTYQHYYKRKPNCYMIATNLPPAKLLDLRDYVVKPNWISDSFTLDIEAISCDEMFADVTNVLQQASCSPNEFAEFLRKKIEEKTLCTASVGLGPNMLVARVANRFAKPNGHHFVDSSNLPAFFETVSVKDLPGDKKRAWALCYAMGVETCKQLQALPLETLKAKFGVKTSSLLYNYARGIDNRSLQFDKLRKSVSAEVNYGIRFKEVRPAAYFITRLQVTLCSQTARLHVPSRFCCNKTHLDAQVRQKDAPVNPSKYMGHGLCDNLAKSSHLLAATASKAIISKECYSLAMQMHLVASDIRGVGIQVGRLEPLPSGQGGGVKTMLDFLTTSRTPESHGAAGPSSGTTNGMTESLPKAVSLPAFSEIDPAVLDSLPPDIKDEVLTMYRESRRNPLRSK